MQKTLKRIHENTKRLSASERRFENIYEIIFGQGDVVMTELPTMTRKVTCTYAQAKEKIEAVARGIVNLLGCKEKYIGLSAENSLEWMLLFWGILKSGNKPYLVNLRQPASFTDEILATLDGVCVLTHGVKAEYSLPVYSFESVCTAGQESASALPAFADEFALSTSGTTLEKKICIYNGSNISEQILNVAPICKINNNIVRPYKGQIKMLAFLPLYHIFGLVAMYLWFSFFGATFVFLADMAPEAILRTVRLHKVTHIFAVPLLWHAVEKSVRGTLAKADEKTQEKFEKGLKLSLKWQNNSPSLGKKMARNLLKEVNSQLFGESVQFCISGGSFIKESTLELVNGLGYTLVNGYGMSEIGIGSVELAKRPKERMLASIGMPFPSVEYSIGENSQLLVRGKSVCYKMIINGEERRNDGWFDTGDVVHKDDNGRYYIDGRISDVVFGDDGENLNPDFSEKAFNLPTATAFSVLGTQDGSKLMLVVQVPKGLLSAQKEKLRADIDAFNATLPPSYRVREVWFTYDKIMPELAIKVSRSYLKKAIADGKIKLFASFDELKKATNSEDSEIKGILRTLFAEVLQLPIEEITDDGHFMNDLGGTSLDYFSLVSAINDRFDVQLDFEGENFSYTLNDFEEKIKDLME
ncbi:MAG: AMP-binding protein [Clostridia bacterium]|nr:AMP-binding protein [Clostridia bacterium]